MVNLAYLSIHFKPHLGIKTKNRLVNLSTEFSVGIFFCAYQFKRRSQRSFWKKSSKFLSFSTQNSEFFWIGFETPSQKQVELDFNLSNEVMAEFELYSTNLKDNKWFQRIKLSKNDYNFKWFQIWNWAFLILMILNFIK